MIDYATPAMLPALKAIWQICFGDDEEYTEFLFRLLLNPGKILTYTDAGLPVAMLCLEPFKLQTASVAGNDSADGAYVFGVATLPEHQGRGLSTALLDEAHRRLTGQGAALSVLVPAGESLFRFYGKRGYETAFDVCKATLMAEDIPAGMGSCVLEPAALGTLKPLRDSIFADRAQYVSWSEAFLHYIGDECEMMGGEVLTVEGERDRGFAVCYRMDSTVTIKELAVPDYLYNDTLAAIHTWYGGTEYHIYLPADARMSWPNKVLPFAMVKWYDKKKQAALTRVLGRAAYLAHVLD